MTFRYYRGIQCLIPSQGFCTNRTATVTKGASKEALSIRPASKPMGRFSKDITTTVTTARADLKTKLAHGRAAN